MFTINTQAAKQGQQEAEHAAAAAALAEEEARKLAAQAELDKLNKPVDMTVGGILVVNTQLVPEKILCVIQEGLKLMRSAAVRLLVFNKELPANDLRGEYYYPGRAAAVNVSNVVRDAHERAMLVENRFDVIGLSWMGLCVTVLHEIAHSMPEVDHDEDKAKEMSYSILRELARRFNLEVPGTMNAGVWGSINDGLMEYLAEIDEPWAKFQMTLREEEALFIAEDGSCIVRSFREWVRYSDDGPDQNHSSWQQGVIDMVLERPITDGKPELPIPSWAMSPTISPEGVSAATPMPVMPTHLVEDMGMVGVQGYSQEYGTESVQSPVTHAHLPELNTGGPVPMPNLMADPNTGGPAGFKPQDTTAKPAWFSGMLAPQITMPPEQVKAVKEAVLLRLFHHMFWQCGFLSNGTFDPNAKLAIRKGVLISDIPGAQEIFLGCDCGTGPTDTFTREVPLLGEAQGCLRGWVSKNGNISYILHMNSNGNAVKVLLQPQQPGTKPGAQTMASNGNPIAWVSIAGGDLCYKLCVANGNLCMEPAKRA